MHSLIFLISLILHAAAYGPAFDYNYETFIKNNSIAEFGYDMSHVCTIIKISDAWYAGIADAYTIFRAPYTKIQTINPLSNIQQCFNYRTHSYIISLIGNSTSIMRGRLTNNFRFPKYDRIIYDHISAKLYSINENNISEVNLSMVENFWTINNYAQKMVKEHRSISLKDLFILRDRVEVNFSDLIILNNTIYYIKKEVDNFGIYKKNINESVQVFVSKINVPLFNFIPFIQISNHGNPKINTAASTIVLTLPSHNIKNKENLSIEIAVLWYFLDIFFVILTLWVMKYLYKHTKNKYEDMKTQPVDTQENHISLASLPFSNNLVTSQ